MRWRDSEQWVALAKWFPPQSTMVALLNTGSVTFSSAVSLTYWFPPKSPQPLPRPLSFKHVWWNNRELDENQLYSTITDYVTPAILIHKPQMIEGGSYTRPQTISNLFFLQSTIFTTVWPHSFFYAPSLQSLHDQLSQLFLGHFFILHLCHSILTIRFSRKHLQ